MRHLDWMKKPGNVTPGTLRLLDPSRRPQDVWYVQLTTNHGAFHTEFLAKIAAGADLEVGYANTLAYKGCLYIAEVTEIDEIDRNIILDVIYSREEDDPVDFTFFR